MVAFAGDGSWAAVFVDGDEGEDGGGDVEAFANGFGRDFFRPDVKL